jgi:hypothetical protein
MEVEFQEVKNLPKHYNGCRRHGSDCTGKHCPWCGAEYVNYVKHLRTCPPKRRWMFELKSMGSHSHKALTDTDMRLSGRTRSGGLDS